MMKQTLVSKLETIRLPFLAQCLAAVLLLLLLASPVGAATLFAGGAGTSADPWQISTQAQLNSMRQYYGADGARFFVLINDIDLNVAPFNQGVGWEPVGTDENRFNNTFDGNGYAINGLFINRPETVDVGLFGFIEFASIKNIQLSNVMVTGSSTVGALVGTSYRSNISHSSATGVVEGYVESGLGGNPTSMAGGLVGFNRWQSTISNSFAAVEVRGGKVVGGLAGESEGAITGSYASGKVSGGWEYVGGLVGLAYGLIQNSYATGDVSGVNSVGGLVGASSFNMGTIDSCYATGVVSGTGDNVGGLVGKRTGGVITTAYYNTDTTGQSDVGRGEPRSSAEMRQAATFVGWDFPNLWKIMEGITFPYLSWQPDPSPPTADGDVAPLNSRDGIINVGDALVCLRFALNLETPTPADIIHADVAPLDSNGQPAPDGVLNVGDALVILRKAVGLVDF